MIWTFVFASIGALLCIVAAFVLSATIHLEVHWPGESTVYARLDHVLLNVKVDYDIAGQDLHVEGIPERFVQKLVARSKSEPESEKAEAPVEDPADDEREPIPFEKIIAKAEPVIGPALVFVTELPRIVRIRDAELSIMYGLGQPDWTGLATGMIAATTAALPIRVRTFPRWFAVDAGAEALLQVEIEPSAAIGAVLRFAARTAREWVSVKAAI